MKYAFVGSHGTGKSSAAHFLAAKLKKEDPSKAIKVLEESVRIISKLVGINNLSFQKLAVLDSLYNQELYKSSYDIIICDRIPLDYIVYGQYYNVDIPLEYVDIAYSNAYSFDKIYFVRPDNTPIVDDGFRMTDINVRNDIDKLVKDKLDWLEISYEEIRTEDVFK